MATHGDEGRGKLRKASVRCKQSLTRRYPNGETPWESRPKTKRMNKIVFLERDPLK